MNPEQKQIIYFPASPDKNITNKEIVKIGDTEISLNAFDSPGFIIFAILITLIILSIIYVKFILNPRKRRTK